MLLQTIFLCWRTHCAEERRILHAWALWWQRRLRQCMQSWHQHTCNANRFRTRVVRVRLSKLKRLFKVGASSLLACDLIGLAGHDTNEPKELGCRHTTWLHAGLASDGCSYQGCRSSSTITVLTMHAATAKDVLECMGNGDLFQTEAVQHAALSAKSSHATLCSCCLESCRV